jgi:DNA-binding response OmpR family regulator
MQIKRVLLVDDDESARAFLRLFFERENLDVSEAADGEMALKAARKECFDLVVTDLQMPRMGGLEVLRGVKHIRPDTMVLILTGSPSCETMEKAAELGCDGFFTKPVKFADLRRVISLARHAPRDSQA